MTAASQIVANTLQAGFVAGLMCLVLAPQVMQAQSNASTTVIVGLRHHEETFTASRPSWREDALSVWLNASGISTTGSSTAQDAERRQRAAISFDVGRAERFGEGQEFGGIDFYRGLGGRTYMNVRLRAAPRAVVIPELDLTGGITTGFAGDGRHPPDTASCATGIT